MISYSNSQIGTTILPVKSNFSAFEHARLWTYQNCTNQQCCVHLVTHFIQLPIINNVDIVKCCLIFYFWCWLFRIRLKHLATMKARNAWTDVTFPNNCSNSHIWKMALFSIWRMRDNKYSSCTFTHIILMFKKNFEKDAFLWFIRAMKVAVIAEKKYITRFNLVTVLFELYICYRYVIWWKYRNKIQAVDNTPTCTKRVSKQGCDRASAKSYPRGRGLFYVDISGTSSVKWLYQVSMTYLQLISAAAFFPYPQYHYVGALSTSQLVN